MLRWLHTTLWIALAAVVGALLGRLAAELRHRAESGDDLVGALDEISLDPRTLAPRELVPGLVAAVRARDVPWSYLHVPPWLAALSVNCGAAVLARELAQLDELMDVRPPQDRGTPAWEPGAPASDEPIIDVREVTDDSAGPGSPPSTPPERAAY